MKVGGTTERVVDEEVGPGCSVVLMAEPGALAGVDEDVCGEAGVPVNLFA